MGKFYEWFDDKTQVIFVILVFGLGALWVQPTEALPMIEKLAYGLLGMAVGKGLQAK